MFQPHLSLIDPRKLRFNYRLNKIWFNILKLKWRVKNSRQKTSVVILIPFLCTLFVFTLLTANSRELETSNKTSGSEWAPTEKQNKIIRICGMGNPILSDIKRNTFQRVQGVDVYVYSAYLDRRVDGAHKIRIIGIASTANTLLHCLVYYMNGTVLNSPAEKVTAILDPSLHKNFKYRPTLYYCSETWGKAVKVGSVVLKGTI